MRSRLIAMRFFVDRATAELAAAAWWGLSNACHHHAYELTPTTSEIRHLVGQVARVIGLVTDDDKGEGES